VLEFTDWSFWFFFSYSNVLMSQWILTKITKLTDGVNSETISLSLTERWIKWNNTNISSFKTTDIKNFCDLRKIDFLTQLRVSDTILTKKKMRIMLHTYKFENQNDEIR